MKVRNEVKLLHFNFQIAKTEVSISQLSVAQIPWKNKKKMSWNRENLSKKGGEIGEKNRINRI